MKNMKVVNNGVIIPDTTKCLWCGGEMQRKGSTHMGGGVNSFTLWCENCGAIAHHARDFHRKISSFDISYQFNNEKD